MKKDDTRRRLREVIIPHCSVFDRPYLVTKFSFQSLSMEKIVYKLEGFRECHWTVGLGNSPCEERLWGQDWFSPEQR